MTSEGPGPQARRQTAPVTPLETALADYLLVRRGMGFSLVRDEKLLRQFLGFMDEHGKTVVTVDDAVAWTRLPASAGTKWLSMRMNVVRSFAAYLHQLDPAHQVPAAGLFPAGTARAVPYLYSAEQIAALIQAALTLRYPMGRATYQTLFGLLACTGMRVGEAIALDDTHLDLPDGVLTVGIEGSKNSKRRLVPLHPTAVQAIAAYQRERDRLLPHRPSPALLVSTAGTRLWYTCVWHTFAKLRDRAGLHARSSLCRPRIHDLRHAFAVATLTDWYRDGVDVQANLPVLSAYLGHTDPKHTFWYFDAAPELLGLAAERLERHLSRQYPATGGPDRNHQPA